MERLMSNVKLNTLFLVNIFLLILFFTSYTARAEEPYISYPDNTPGPYTFEISSDLNRQTAFAGADLFMSSIEIYRMLDDKLTANSDSALLRVLMIIPRFKITNYIATSQHEIYGHGARVREIGKGWKVKSYMVDLEPKSLYASGVTNFLIMTNSHPQYMVSTCIAGIQATEILGNKIQNRMLNSGKVNPVYGAAYWTSATNKVQYTHHTKYKVGPDYIPSGHDVADYIIRMNKIYGEGYLSKSKVKANAALDLLDPFLYYSLYSLVSGQEFEYPMIPIGEWKYLPAFRGIFTPYGLEKKWINHVKTPLTTGQLNFTHGTNKVGSSWSVELIVDKIFSSENIDIGFNIATWKQPKLFFVDPLKAPNKQGGGGEINIKLHLNEISAIYTAIGYKTPGFKVGYPMKSCGLVRVGLALKF